MAVYKDTSSLFQKSNAHTSSATKTVYGIALNNALSGQPLAVQRTGTITIGATVTVAKVYVLSATSGAICPVADITTQGDVISIIGVGTSSTVITLGINNSGAAIP